MSISKLPRDAPGRDATMGTDKKMKWNRLKDMKCPKCSSSKLLNLLEKEDGMPYYKCMSTKCEFIVGKTRFEEIINSLYLKK